jgi:hypothetical protein
MSEEGADRAGLSPSSHGRYRGRITLRKAIHLFLYRSALTLPATLPTMT